MRHLMPWFSVLSLIIGPFVVGCVFEEKLSKAKPEPGSHPRRHGASGLFQSSLYASWLLPDWRRGGPPIFRSYVFNTPHPETTNIGASCTFVDSSDQP
jgi:hypothetical protein